MKNILLLRHAKSSHDDSSLKDFDRPLALRGRRDAPAMGTFIRETGCLPGTIISSTAERARQTTQLIVKSTGLDKAMVQWSKDMYYGSSQDYLEAIQNNEGATDTMMLVGHNPKIEDIGRRLCGNGSINMPTAGLACFEQPANEWSEIQEGLASLKWIMTPKLLTKMDG